MNSTNHPFKIITTLTKNSKNVVRIDWLLHWKPPVAMRVGTGGNRKTIYHNYLITRFKESNAVHFDELQTLYRYASKKGEITLDDGFKAPWVKEAFKDFLLSVMTALGQTCDSKVDIDAPFSGW